MSDIYKFVVGQAITFQGRARWWVRLWRWVTRWKPGVLTVTHIDYEAGEITMDRSTEDRR